MKTGLKYEILKKEIVVYLPMMNQAADTVMDQDVSKYPIFVFHQQEVAIGINVVDKSKVKGNWSVNVSTMEEFVAKQLIAETNVENFKKKYEDPSLYFCLFVLSELGAEFIFIPRKY
jgi:hypothetical protein